jgi:hypothetical protein
VTSRETLAHYLNELSGAEPFANLGLDGTHPAALEGLLKHYADDAPKKAVLLHFNPLWMTSTKHDLQTNKEFHFNHPKLVAQFRPKIPCYKASFSTRLWAVIERRVRFFSWASHLRTAHWEDLGMHAWTMAHPYSCPIGALRRSLPAPGPAGEEPPASRPAAQSRKQNLAWVEPVDSLQWRFFQRSVLWLKECGSDVFVLVGPFNEHMLTKDDVARYGAIKGEIETWLQAHDVPCFLPAPLPAAVYVDASHPVGEGYALLAKGLFADPTFKAWAQRNNATSK